MINLPYISRVCHKIFHMLSAVFMQGILTLLPLILTITIINFTFHLLVSWLAPIRILLSRFFTPIPYLEFILAVFIIIIVGFITRTLVAHYLFDVIDRYVKKLPFVRFIYTGIKQLMFAINPQEQSTVTKVVMVPFPNQQTYTIGFLTGTLTAQFSPDQTQEWVSVFVPAAPNPTSGFCILVQANQVRLLSLTKQEAIAFIISGGIVTPNQGQNSQL